VAVTFILLLLIVKMIMMTMTSNIGDLQFNVGSELWLGPCVPHLHIQGILSEVRDR
jgi:hypothetical protein